MRQSAIIEAIQPPDKNISMNNDKANVVFRFIRFPEYIKPGARLLFREGRTKGMGRVTEIVPYEHVQNRWQKISRSRKNSGKLTTTLTLKKIKKVTFACPGKSPRKKKRIRIPKEEEFEEKLSLCRMILAFILFVCFLLFMLTFIDPELFKLVITIWADPEHLFRIFPSNNCISETLILFAKL